MIQIDGNYLEGGGQIVRSALAFSALTGESIEVTDIRKGRPVPGLKAQHLQCIKAFEILCNATSEGAALGSTALKFFPGRLAPKSFDIDIGTAGSISLLLQSILPVLLFSGKKTKVEITGGTDTRWAMPFDYLNHVFLPHLQKFAKVDISLKRRGYYPKGQGRVVLKVNPRFHAASLAELRQIIHEDVLQIMLIDQGRLLQIKGISHASIDLQKASVAERQAKACESVLKQRFNCPINIQSEYANTACPGSGITLWAVFSSHDDIDFNNPVIIGSDGLGERGMPSEDVGVAAAKDLIREIESGAAVDHHLEDNLIPFLALAGGKIRVSELTPHTLTNIYTIEKFLGKTFKINEKEKIIEAEVTSVQQA